MQAAAHNPTGNRGNGPCDSAATANVCEPAKPSEAAGHASPSAVDYRALYFEAAGHRNSLLIEVKSLKSHVVLLNQECVQLSAACAKAVETSKARQEEVDRFAERHAVTLARLDRFERSVWGRLQSLCDRLVMVITGHGNARSPAREPVPFHARGALETE